MAPASTSPVPGNMTVPPMFGWEDILTVLVTTIAVGLAFLVIGAVLASLSGRGEWQAFLDARSRHRDHDDPAELIEPGTF
jgi:hypothetical protein